MTTDKTEFDDSEIGEMQRDIDRAIEKIESGNNKAAVQTLEDLWAKLEVR